MWQQDLSPYIHSAQAAAPFTFDPTVLLTNGPLGMAVFAMLYWNNQLRQQIEKLETRIEKMLETHKTEVAAERALNAQIQDKRFEDQKVLVPLASSMLASAEQTHDILKKLV